MTDRTDDDLLRQLQSLGEPADEAKRESSVPDLFKVPAEPARQPDPAREEPAPGESVTAFSFAKAGVFDSLTLEQQAEKWDRLAAARKESSNGLFGELDKLEPKDRLAWIKGEQDWNDKALGFWDGVRGTLMQRPEDGSEPKYTAENDAVRAWLIRKATAEIQLAKHRRQLADEMERGEREPPRFERWHGSTVLGPLGFIPGRATVEGISGSLAQVGASLIKGLGYATQYLADKPLTKVDENTIYKFGGVAETWGKAMFPQDKARENEFAQKWAEGAGSMIAFMGPGLAANVIAKAGPMTMAMISGMTGSLAQAGSMADDARKAVESGKPTRKLQIPYVTGQDDDAVTAAFLLGLPIGASEALPLAHLFGSAQGQFIKRVLVQMFEEGGQEFGQQIAENLVARAFYDDKRHWDDNAWEGMAIGAMLGAKMQVGADLYRASLEALQKQKKGQPGAAAPGEAAPVQVARAGQKGVVRDVEPALPDPMSPAAPAPEAAPATSAVPAVTPPEAPAEPSEGAQFQADVDRARQIAPVTGLPRMAAMAVRDVQRGAPVSSMPQEAVDYILATNPELARKLGLTKDLGRQDLGRESAPGAAPAERPSLSDVLGSPGAPRAAEGPTPFFDVTRELGRPRAIVTPDGAMEVEATPQLVELTDLRLASGDMQPRDRSRAESEAGIRERAAALDPERLMPGRVSDNGAPIVAPDGTIISGNGRVLSIAQVYSDPALRAQADAYKAALGPEAAQMHRPVLVSLLPEGTAREDLVRLADLSNRSGVAQMSATERAQRDARAAGPEITGLYQGGSFTSPANQAFFRAFNNQVVSAAERGAVSRNGLLTKEGEDRMSAAILAAAYGDSELLSRMLESTDDMIRSVTGAMRDAAGAFIRLKEAIRLGEADAQFDITPQIAETARRIADLRERGIRPDMFLAQQDAFTTLDPTVAALLRAFYNDDMTRQLGREKLTELLNAYAEEASKHQAEGLIPDETSVEDIIVYARERALRADRDAERLRASQGDLLGAGRASGRPDAGAGREAAGRAPVESGPGARSGRQDVGAGKRLGRGLADLAAQNQGNAAAVDRVAGTTQGAENARATTSTQTNAAPTADDQRRDAALRNRFRQILAGKAPRSQWAQMLRLEADPATMQALLDDAKAQGLVRIDRNGKVSRTKAAKAAPRDTNLRAAGGAQVLAVPPDMRVGAAVRAYEAETRRRVSPKVRELADSLEAAKGTQGFAELFATLQDLARRNVLSKAEALQLAHLVGARPSAKTSRAQALSSIQKRHEDLVGYQISQGMTLAALGEVGQAREEGASQRRDLDALGYYSQALEAAKGLKQAKGTPEQMRSQLRKAGVKEAELKALKLDDYFAQRQAEWEQRDSRLRQAPPKDAQGGFATVAFTPEEAAALKSNREGTTPFRGKAPIITKDEIVSYLAANRVEVREAVYGDPLKNVSFEQSRGSNPVWQIVAMEPEYRGGPMRRRVVASGYATEEEARADAPNTLDFSGVESDAKWKRYSIDPDNPTYRETVFHLPSNGDASEVEIARAKDWIRERSGQDPEQEWGYANEGDYITLASESFGMPTNVRADFINSHFAEPNVIAHARTSLQKNADEQTVFLVDELQSDWGQKLRDGGMRDEAKIARLRSDLEDAKVAYEVANAPLSLELDAIGVERWGSGEQTATDVQVRAQRYLNDYIAAKAGGNSAKIGEMVGTADRVQQILDQSRKLYDKVRLAEAELKTAETAPPSHPLVNTTDQWMTTAFRRLIRQAVEAGADYIALTPGKVQAERFNLARSVGSLRYDPEMKELQYTQIINRDGQADKYFSKFDNDGKAVEVKDLPGIIGKEMAERLLAQPRKYVSAQYSVAGPHTLDLSGENASIGGSGMKATYDSIYPRTLGKMLAKMDKDAGVMKDQELWSSLDERKFMPPWQRDMDDITGIQFHTFPLTQALKERVLTEGQALFSLAGVGRQELGREGAQSGTSGERPSSTSFDLAAREAYARAKMSTKAWAEAAERPEDPARDTSKQPGYGSPEWAASRIYVANGAKIVGVEAAVAHLAQEAIAAVPGGAARERRAFIIIGYPGAGKTTIANALQKTYAAARMVGDDVKLIIPEYEGGRNNGGVKRESDELAAAAAMQLATTGTNLILETSGAPVDIQSKAAAMRSQGYQVGLVFVDVPKAIAMERAVARQGIDGRPVPLRIYDTLNPQQSFATSRSEGVVDEAAHITWDEGTGQFRLADADAGLEPLRAAFEPASGGQPGARAGSRSPGLGEGLRDRGQSGQSGQSQNQVADQGPERGPSRIEQGLFALREALSFGRTLGTHADIRTNFPDADFWIIRKGSEKAVGTPTREYSPEHIGIRVRNHLILPDYLYYALMHAHGQGFFRERAHGTLNLKNIKVADVKSVPIEGPSFPTVLPALRQSYSPRFKAALPEFASRLQRELEAMVPSDVAVRVVDRIIYGAEQNQYAQGQEAYGNYDPNKRLMQVALSAGTEFARGFGRHEVVHVLRGYGKDGLFTSAEWQVLLERAAKIGVDAQMGEGLALYESIYRGDIAPKAARAGLSDDFVNRTVNEWLDQERVAWMVQTWESGTRYGSVIDGLLARIARFLEAVRNALRGLGFQTADDVFERMVSGEVADRAGVGRGSEVDPQAIAQEVFGNRDAAEELLASPEGQVALEEARGGAIYPLQYAFAGPRAQSADGSRLARAQTLDAQGVSPQEIWKQTGWFKRQDGWRFEIDDSKIALHVGDMSMSRWRIGKDAREALSLFLGQENGDKDAVRRRLDERVQDLAAQKEELRRRGEPNDAYFDKEIKRYRGYLADLEKVAIRKGMREIETRTGGKAFVYRGTLGDLIEAPDLFAAYPSLSSVNVQIQDPTSFTSSGSYNPSKRIIKVSASGDKTEILDTLLHEIQHAIQTEEGWDNGGNDSTLLHRTEVALFDITRQLETLRPGSNIRADLERLRDELRAQALAFGGGISGWAVTNAGSDAYQRLLGEVEARNVTTRRPMSAAERRGSFPLSTEDVLPGEQYAGSQLTRLRVKNADLIDRAVRDGFAKLPDMTFRYANGDPGVVGVSLSADIEGRRSNVAESIDFTPEDVAKRVKAYGLDALIKDLSQTAPIYRRNAEAARADRRRWPDSPRDLEGQAASAERVAESVDAVVAMLKDIAKAYPDLKGRPGYEVTPLDPEGLIERYAGRTFTPAEHEALVNRIKVAIADLEGVSISVKDHETGKSTPHTIDADDIYAIGYDFDAQGIDNEYGIDQSYPEAFAELYKRNRDLIDEYRLARDYIGYASRKNSVGLSASYNVLGVLHPQTMAALTPQPDLEAFRIEGHTGEVETRRTPAGQRIKIYRVLEREGAAQAAPAQRPSSTEETAVSDDSNAVLEEGLPTDAADAAPSRPQGLASIVVSEQSDGSWEVTSYTVAKARAGTTLVAELIDAAEADLGRTVSEKGWMSPAGYARAQGAGANVAGHQAAGDAAPGVMGGAKAVAIAKAVKGAMGGGLDMSPEARKARAEAMGFDTSKVWYHGTGGGLRFNAPEDADGRILLQPPAFTAFSDAKIGSRHDGGHYGRGHYLVNSPGEASYYGEHVSAYYVRGNYLDLDNNTGDLTYAGHFKSFAPKLDAIGALGPHAKRALEAMLAAEKYVADNVTVGLGRNSDGSDGYLAKVNAPAGLENQYPYGIDSFRGRFHATPEAAIEAVTERFKDEMARYHPEAFPGLGDEPASLSDYIRVGETNASALTEKAKAAGYDGISYGDELVVFNPANIRSVNAAFDPAETNSSVLLSALAGIKAVGAPLSSRNLAESMERKGRKPEQILKDTGWFRGPDSKWRFEIDDSKAALKDLNAKLVKPQNSVWRALSGKRAPGLPSWAGKDVRLGLNLSLPDVLTHDKLFKAYPFLNKMRVSMIVGPGVPASQQGGALMFRRANGGIVYDPIQIKARTQADILPTLMHELQHYIQQKEGFAEGSNTSGKPDLKVKPLNYGMAPSDQITVSGETFSTTTRRALGDGISNRRTSWRDQIAGINNAESLALAIADIWDGIRKLDGGDKHISLDMTTQSAIGALVNRENEKAYAAYKRSGLSKEYLQKYALPRLQAELMNTLRVSAEDYMSSAGEAEANAVMERLNYTPEQRRTMLLSYGPSKNIGLTSTDFRKVADTVLESARRSNSIREKWLQEPVQLGNGIAVFRPEENALAFVLEKNFGWRNEITAALDWKNGRAFLQFDHDAMNGKGFGTSDKAPGALTDKELSLVADAAEAYVRSLNLLPTADPRLMPNSEKITGLVVMPDAGAGLSEKEIAFWKSRDPFFMVDADSDAHAPKSLFPWVWSLEDGELGERLAPTMINRLNKLRADDEKSSGEPFYRDEFTPTDDRESALQFGNLLQEAIHNASNLREAAEELITGRRSQTVMHLYGFNLKDAAAAEKQLRPLLDAVHRDALNGNVDGAPIELPMPADYVTAKLDPEQWRIRDREAHQEPERLPVGAWNGRTLPNTGRATALVYQDSIDETWHGSISTFHPSAVSPSMGTENNAKVWVENFLTANGVTFDRVDGGEVDRFRPLASMSMEDLGAEYAELRSKPWGDDVQGRIEELRSELIRRSNARDAGDMPKPILSALRLPWSRTPAVAGTVRTEGAMDPGGPRNWGGPGIEHDPKGLYEIIEDLKSAIGMPVTQGLNKLEVKGAGRTWRFRPKGNVMAQYETPAGVARTRLSSDIEAIAHEGGHHIERLLAADIQPLLTQHRQELALWGGDVLATPSTQLSEDFAQWFKDYVLKPERAKGLAPRLHEAFEELLDANRPDILEAIDKVQLVTLSKDWADYVKADTLQQMRADLASDAPRPAAARAREFLANVGQDGTVSGMASQLYENAIDELHPNYLEVKKYLELADRNKVVDAEGRAISLSVHENPYKLLRSVGDAFKTGLRWIQDGMPNYRHGDEGYQIELPDGRIVATATNLAEARRLVATAGQGAVMKPMKGHRSPSLHDALSLAFGKNWDHAQHQNFGGYLESRRAREEWMLWNAKVARMAEINGLLERGTNDVAQPLDPDTFAALRAELKELKEKGVQRPPHRVDLETHEERIRQLEEANPQYGQAAQMVYDFLWQQAIHDWQAGRLTKEQLDYRATRKHFYVPFARSIPELEAAGLMSGGRGFGGRTPKFAKDKAFKGSDRDVVNPIETIIDQTFHRAAATHLNDAVKAYVALADKVGPGAGALGERVTKSALIEANEAAFRNLEQQLVAMGYDFEDAQEQVKRIESDFGDTQLLLQYDSTAAGPAKPLNITFWENGERKVFRVNDLELAQSIFNSVNGVGREMSNLIMDVVAAPATLLRAGVVTNPAFVLPNIIRDAWSAWTLTGSLLDPRTWPGVTQMRGLYHELAQTDQAKLYQEVAGLMGGQNVAALSKVRDKADVMALEEKGLHVKPLRAITLGGAGGAAGYALAGAIGVAAGAPALAGLGVLLGIGLHKGIRNFGTTVAHVADMSETATRLGVFTQAYETALKYNPSLTPYQAAQEAAYVARDLIDFGRHGSTMLSAARLVPFLNANVQGLDKAVRSLLARSDRGMGISVSKLTGVMAAGAGAGFAVAGPVGGAVGTFLAPALATNIQARVTAARALLNPITKKDMGLPLSLDEERALGTSARAWTNLLIYTAILTSFPLLYTRFRDDDDEEKRAIGREYQMVNEKVKFKAQPVKIMGEWHSFPKAFEWSVPSNIIEAAIDAKYGKDPRFWERVRDGLIDVLSPPAIPQAVRMWSDIRSNYDSLGKRPLVPDHLRTAPPEEQFNAYASQLAIQMSKAVNESKTAKTVVEGIGSMVFANNFELTPAIIDYALRTGGGYWGKDAQRMSDVFRSEGPTSAKMSNYPLIGTVVGRFELSPYEKSDAKEAFYKTMGRFTEGYPRAATGFKTKMDSYGPAAANTYLATLDEDQRAYALVEAGRSPNDKRMHPFNRLRDLVLSVQDIQRDIALQRLANTEAKKDPEPIRLGPAKADEVKDLLNQVIAVEAENTMIFMKHKQFAERTPIPLDPIMATLKAAAPAVAQELEVRMRRKKVQDWSDVTSEWPSRKAEILRDWQEAVDEGRPLDSIKPKKVVKPPIGGAAPEPAPGPAFGLPKLRMPRLDLGPTPSEVPN